GVLIGARRRGSRKRHRPGGRPGRVSVAPRKATEDRLIMTDPTANGKVGRAAAHAAHEPDAQATPARAAASPLQSALQLASSRLDQLTAPVTNGDSATAWLSRAEELAAWTARRLVNRVDAWGTYRPDAEIGRA